MREQKQILGAPTAALHCPKCRTTPLRAPGPSGTPVLRCYACHGMWVTVEQAEALALNGTLLDPVSMLPQKARGEDLAGLCPSGHGIMVRAKVDLDESFYLERCARCGGIWFDAGEWSKLASSHLVHHLRDLWDPAWQRRMREEQREERHRDRVKGDIGPELVGELERLTKVIKQHPRRDVAMAYLLDLLKD